MLPLFLLLLIVSVGSPAAVLLACRRYGAQRLLAPVVLISLCIAWLFDPSLGFAPFVGLIAGLQIERRKSYGQIIAAAAIPGVLQALLLLVGQEVLPREEVVDQLLGQFEGLEQYPAGEGNSLREHLLLLMRILPGAMFTFMLFTAVMAYRLSQVAAGYLQVALPQALPFGMWRPWNQLIWVLIAGLALLLLGSGKVEDLALNLMAVMAILYAVQGLAVLRFYIRRLGIPGLVELLFYLILVFTSSVALFLLAGLGLMDTWFDWRRLEPAADQTPTEGDGRE